MRYLSYPDSISVRYSLYPDSISLRYFLYPGSLSVRYFLYPDSISVNSLFLKVLTLQQKEIIEGHKKLEEAILRYTIWI